MVVYNKINTLMSSITLFYVSKQGQASALKVAYIIKVFGAQTCLMVA